MDIHGNTSRWHSRGSPWLRSVHVSRRQDRPEELLPQESPAHTCLESLMWSAEAAPPLSNSREYESGGAASGTPKLDSRIVPHSYESTSSDLFRSRNSLF